MDSMLWNLCQRDQLIALRDQARRQQAAGSTQAGHVVEWMERVLTDGTPIASAPLNPPDCLVNGSGAPVPHHSRHRAPEPMQTR